MKHSVKFLVMDVDGTLTDGSIYIGDSGEIFKSFCAKDGYAIQKILPQYNIVPIVLTGRKSNVVSARCSELGVSLVFQGVDDKLVKLVEIISDYSEKTEEQYSLGDVAYIGDDIPDLACMKRIRSENGVVGCPKDAVHEVKKCASFVSRYCGGSGAVRDFIEWLLK